MDDEELLRRKYEGMQYIILNYRQKLLAYTETLKFTKGSTSDPDYLSFAFTRERSALTVIIEKYWESLFIKAYNFLRNKMRQKIAFRMFLFHYGKIRR